MGLDMFIEEARKPSYEEIKKKKAEGSLSDFFMFPVDELSNEERELLPYCVKETVDTIFIDMKKLLTAYNVPENARRTGASYGDTIKYHYKDAEDKYYEIELTEKELEKFEYTKPVEYYITDLEEVYYWRKYYELQEYIYELMEEEGKYVENCGYYHLTEDMIKAINDKFEEKIWYQDNLFYHEWY